MTATDLDRTEPENTDPAREALAEIAAMLGVTWTPGVPGPDASVWPIVHAVRATLPPVDEGQI